MMRGMALAALLLLSGCARLRDQAAGMFGPRRPEIVVPPGAVGGEAGLADDAGASSGVAGGLIVETLKRSGVAARP